MSEKRKNCEKTTVCQCRDCKSLRRRLNTGDSDNGSRVSWFWAIAETLDECVCDAVRCTSFRQAENHRRTMEEMGQEDYEKRLNRARKKYGPRSRQCREIKRAYGSHRLKVFHVVHTFCINRDYAQLPGGVQTNPKRWAKGKAR